MTMIEAESPPTSRRRVRPPKRAPKAPPTPRPRWQVVAIEAKRAALAALPAEEQEQARRDQVAARERSKARSEAKAAMIRAIFDGILEGSTLREIARAVGRTVRTVRATCALWGFPAHQRAGYRRSPLFWTTDENYAALVRAASDRGVRVAELLEE